MSNRKTGRDSDSGKLPIKQFAAPDDAAFGLWRDRQRDGLEYQVEVRAEWDA